MANWAIVIGVNKYWTPKACLSAAVPDALRMREWLLDKDGGAVPRHNLFLLLSSNKADEVPAGLDYLDATNEMIVTVIDGVVKRSGGAGERLFFHYSGHGLSAWMNFSEQDALVPTDFTPQFPTRSLSLSSILDYFKATQLRDQFFFIDACRNIPWEGDFRIGEMPWAKRREAGKSAVQQFVFYATSPGVKAAESNLAGQEQGAFTDTLLKGLKGHGRAKLWNYLGNEYLVRVNRLFEYLVGEMEKKRILVVDKPGAELFQVPRLGGERGALSGSDPVLARFPASAIEQASLEVLVAPFSVEAQASVVVEREQVTVGKTGPIESLPVSFALPPKEYVVQAEAVEYEASRRPVDLYDSQQVTIELVPKQQADVTVVVRSGGESTPMSDERRWADFELAYGQQFSDLMLRSPMLLVTTTDPNAPLEIASSDGKLIEIGQGWTSLEGLPAGFYRARVVLPEGRSVEKLVEYSKGFHVARLEVPEPVTSQVLEEAINRELRNRSTFQLVFSVEGEERSKFEFRLWSRERDVSVPLLHWKTGSSAFREEIESGDYWLAIETLKQEPIVLALKLLPQRETIIIVEATAKAKRISQYSRALTEETEDAKADDADNVRRLDLAHRFYLNGRLDHALSFAQSLTDSPAIDPLAACLAGYLSLMMDLPEQVPSMARRLIESFPELADGYLLRAEYEEGQQNHEAAAEFYRAAAERGLPIVSEGLVKLLDGIARYEIEHPLKNLLVRMVKKRVRGMIWSAWSPASLSPQIFL
jgi:uncharacterized caspase-like protein